MRLGALEILTAPGELTPEVGARVLEMMSGPHTGIFGLTIDEFGYILEATQFTDPHYRYERSVSLGPKTAEHLIAAHRGLLS